MIIITVYIPQKGYVFSEVWCTYLVNIFSPRMSSSILENTLILLPDTFLDIISILVARSGIFKKGTKNIPQKGYRVKFIF